MLGFVKIPFLPFGKKKAFAKIPKSDPKGGALAPYLAMAGAAVRQANVVPPKAPPPPAVRPETGPGEAKLASLWAELPPDRLATVVAKWPPAPLGRILSRMDEDAVTALLAGLPPDRAASLSRAVAAATDEAAAKVHTEVGK